MEKEWYLIDNGVQRGPMRAEEMLNYGLTPESMVWTQGMTDWKHAGECVELASILNGGVRQEPPYTGQPQNNYGGAPYYGQNNYGQNNFANSGKSNIAAGLLAIFLGYLGIQYFYIGKVSAGLITILLSIVTCGMWEVVTLIQGIYMLTLTQEQFDNKYVYTTSTFPIL